MTETNLIFDGTLHIVVGGLDVTSSLLSGPAAGGQGLAFNNASPGGFGDCSFRLQASNPFSPFSPISVADIVEGNPSVVQTTAPHGLTGTGRIWFGDMTNFNAGSNYWYTYTVTDATHFSIGYTAGLRTGVVSGIVTLFAQGAWVTVKHGAGPQTLFEGEITSDPTLGTIDGGVAYYDVTCGGLWAKSGRNSSFSRTFVDSGMDNWSLEPANPSNWQADLNGRFAASLPKGGTTEANVACVAYYSLDQNMTNYGGTGDDRIWGLAALLTTSYFNSAQWTITVSTTTTGPYAGSTWTVQATYSNVSFANSTLLLSGFPVQTNAIKIAVFSNQDNVNLANGHSVIFNKLAVLGYGRMASYTISAISLAGLITTTAAHGLAVGDRILAQGSNSTPLFTGYYTVATVPSTTTFTTSQTFTVAGTTGTVVRPWRLEEVMANVATDSGLATSSSIDLTNPVTPALWSAKVGPNDTRQGGLDLLAAQAAAPFDFGFWESKTFRCKKRPATGSIPANNRYLIDATQPGIDFDMRRKVEGAPSCIRVLYAFQDVDGGSSPYAAGSVQQVQPGMNEGFTDNWTAVYDYSSTVMTTAAAINLANQIQAWVSSNSWRGTIRLWTATVPLFGGGSKNAFYIRGGDYISESHIASSSLTPWYIESVDVDADTGCVTLSIGMNPWDFVQQPFKQPTAMRTWRMPGHPPPRSS